jgi:hypothetical protein
MIEGPAINDRVVPMSRGDWPLVRPDGVIDLDARDLLELGDGTLISMQNAGYRWASTPEIAERMARNEPVEPDAYYMRVTPKFDVPAGPQDWLARHVFVGIAEKDARRKPHPLFQAALTGEHANKPQSSRAKV